MNELSLSRSPAGRKNPAGDFLFANCFVKQLLQKGRFIDVMIWVKDNDFIAHKTYVWYNGIQTRSRKGCTCSMGKIAIITDSNSGITQDEGRKLGISVLPMPFYINDVMYLEGITLSQEDFYERLKNDESISTSQPSPAEVCGLWDNLLEEYDEIVHIPMSSGLSASCDTATMLARDYDGRVQVVNNQRISVTQQQSVLDAMNLREEGKSAAEIKEIPNFARK